MRPSVPPRVLVTGALLLSALLAGCGSSSDKSPGAVPSPSASSSSSESAKKTPQDTEPRGTYSWTSRVTRVAPKKAVVDRTRHSGTWRFSETGCDAATCRGRITSSSGAAYGYTWDGARLTVTRKSDAVTQACRRDADGKDVAGTSVTFRRSYTSAPVEVTVTDGPPDRFVVDVVQHSRITKLVKCRDSKRGFRRLTLRLVLTRQN